MYFTYILYSQKHRKIYIGYSADPDNRLRWHNSNNNKGWTRSYLPWKLIYTEAFESKQEAMLREKQLKSFRGRQFAWEKVNENLV